MELFKVELLKLKRSSLLSLGIIFPIIIVIFTFSKVLGMEKIAELGLSEGIYMFSSMAFITLFLPLYIIYVACMVTKVENDNNGWRGLMLFPIKKTSIYLSKYKVMLYLLIITTLSYIVSVNILVFILGNNFILDSIKYSLQIIITTLPIITLLFITGRRFISIIPVITTGVIMLITNIFIAQSKFWIYAPWTYSMMISGGAITNKERYIILMVSIILSLIMFTIDFIDFTKSDIK
ncbi:MAG: ABC transporter permease [Clostridium sp.]|uniref:ABC transporter permease n=1 Tax=Clostridium sp. TaxID=1506 RepID=UPI001DD9607A|nr:ABC transporter permease [Clostridium sp.]MBS5938845.1 ABC transporter permease [Clostridium sp.]MBS5949171.1 ABC transporter permease [Clostridium sp.]